MKSKAVCFSSPPRRPAYGGTWPPAFKSRRVPSSWRASASLLTAFAAGVTGLEPATSAVTEPRSNQSELHPQRISRLYVVRRRNSISRDLQTSGCTVKCIWLYSYCGVEQSGSSRGSTSQGQMNTKAKGDIAEQAAILQALKSGWAVLKPVGDRLPYDLVFDVDETLVRVQVKSAWYCALSQNYVVDSRRTKTNRRVMLRDTYKTTDFDFALVYLEDKDVFYVFPVEVFTAYGGMIHMVEADKRQRRPKSANYRNAWNLILQWAARGETRDVESVKFGEAAGGGNPEPIPPKFCLAKLRRAGVET